MRYTLRFHLSLIVLTGFLPMILMGQSSSSNLSGLNWKRNFISATEILTTYGVNKSDSLNDCFFVYKSGEYIIRGKGKQTDINELLKYVPEIDFADRNTKSFMQKYGASRLADSWFMLKAMQDGVPFDAARDGLSITTSLPERPLNDYDYAKLNSIFSGSYKILHDAYLNKMKFMFRHHGCTAEMLPLQALIERNCEQSELKDEILELYKKYSPLACGKTAPLSEFRNINNEKVSLADYRGKVLVIDIWATWCCSCIEKMPAFISLQKEFEKEKDVVFVAISIDRKRDFNKWKQTVDKENMKPLLNLIACGEESAFSSDYAVAGVPRYMVIDRNGCMMHTHLGAFNKLREIIQKTLNITINR